MLLVGLAKDAPFVQAFDPERHTWSDFSSAEPMPSDFNNPSKQPGFSFQAAYDPGTRTIYCCRPAMCCMRSTRSRRRGRPSAGAGVGGPGWPTLACDPISKRLVVVGAEKQGRELGWSRDGRLRSCHGRVEAFGSNRRAGAEGASRVDGRQGSADRIGGRGAVGLVTAIRPGQGSDASAASLLGATGVDGQTAGVRGAHRNLAPHSRCHPPAGVVGRGSVKNGPCSELLKNTRNAQYPVPCARRNSPLVFDPATKRFVLFGGDHQDTC